MKNSMLKVGIVLLAIVIITSPFFASYEIQWMIAILGITLQIVCVRMILSNSKSFNQSKFTVISLCVVYSTWILGFSLHNIT